jgi:hypothetical protein
MPQYLVTSPDGTKYRITAPEGVTQADVMAYAQSQHQPKPDMNPVYDALRKADAAGNTADATRLANYIRSQGQPGQAPSTPANYENPATGGTNTYFDIPSLSFKERPNNALDTMTEGIGSGMVRFGRGAGNLVVNGLNKILPSDPSLSDLITGDRRAIRGGPFSDEAVREQDELDRPLSQSTPGAVGQAVGQTVASLPLSLGYGAASNAARAVPLAGRVLSNPLVRGGVEGTVNAAAVAPVDQQGDSAELGAGLGAGISALTGTVGRIARGVVQKSGAAQDLERRATQGGRDIFVPVAQAADDNGDIVTNAAKTIYRDVLPLAPGVSAQVKGQSRRAMDAVREMALDAADPTGTNVQAGAGRNPTATLGALKDAFDQEYASTVKNYAFPVPTDFRDQVAARIKTAMPKVDDETLNSVSAAINKELQRFSSGKPTIEGDNLLNAKNAASALYKQMRGPEKAALRSGMNVFDDIISDELNTSVAPGAQADLARYRGLTGPYSAFKQVSKAANAAKANSGQFTPRQLGAAAREGTPIAGLAQAAQGSVGQPMSSYPWIGKAAALGLGWHNPAAVVGSIGGANLLATQTVQRAMMGDTGAQKAIVKLVEAHPEMAKTIQMIVRNAATTQTGTANSSSP